MLGEVVVVVVVVLPRPRGWVDEAAAADAMVIGIGIGPITIKFDCEFNTVQRQTDELKKIIPFVWPSSITGMGSDDGGGGIATMVTAVAVAVRYLVVFRYIGLHPLPPPDTALHLQPIRFLQYMKIASPIVYPFALIIISHHDQRRQRWQQY